MEDERNKLEKENEYPCQDCMILLDFFLLLSLVVRLTYKRYFICFWILETAKKNFERKIRANPFAAFRWIIIIIAIVIRPEEKSDLWFVNK